MSDSTRECDVHDYFTKRLAAFCFPQGCRKMSLLSTSPPTGDSGSEVVVGKRAAESRLLGPLVFLVRAFRTLWSNAKARIGIVLLVLFVLMAILAPLIAPHSPTATDFPPYQGPSGAQLVRHHGQRQRCLLPGGVRGPSLTSRRPGRGRGRHRGGRHRRLDLGLPPRTRRRGSQLPDQPGTGDPPVCHSCSSSRRTCRAGPSG